MILFFCMQNNIRLSQLWFILSEFNNWPGRKITEFFLPNSLTTRNKLRAYAFPSLFFSVLRVSALYLYISFRSYSFALLYVLRASLTTPSPSHDFSPLFPLNISSFFFFALHSSLVHLLAHLYIAHDDARNNARSRLFFRLQYTRAPKRLLCNLDWKLPRDV